MAQRREHYPQLSGQKLARWAHCGRTFAVPLFEKKTKSPMFTDGMLTRPS